MSTKSMSKKLIEFAEANGYEFNPMPPPKVGSTGYMDVWGNTYRSGSIGRDEYGRLYLISRPITFTIEGEGSGTSKVCIFQRYTTKKGGNPNVRSNTIIYHGGGYVEEEEGDSASELFTQTTVQHEAEAIFNYSPVVKEEHLALLAYTEIYLVRDKYGTARLADVQEPILSASKCGCG